MSYVLKLKMFVAAILLTVMLRTGIKRTNNVVKDVTVGQDTNVRNGYITLTTDITDTPKRLTKSALGVKVY